MTQIWFTAFPNQFPRTDQDSNSPMVLGYVTKTGSTAIAHKNRIVNSVYQIPLYVGLPHYGKVVARTMRINDLHTDHGNYVVDKKR